MNSKKFADVFEKKVKRTIDQNRFFNKKDRILVAVSGGKDSTTVVYLLKKLGYKFEAVTVDAHIGCYTEKNLENVRDFCKKHDVKLHEISFRKSFGTSLCYLRDVLKEKGIDLKSCTVCGVLRRYLLNKKARELKATKLVLGHNLDDEAQAILMNLLKNKIDLGVRMGPVPGIIKHDKLVPRVKPLYFAAEKDVETYSRIIGFSVHYGKCPCSVEGFRNAVKDFLNDYEKTNPNIKQNIVKNFMKVLPELKKKFKTRTEPKICALCGEPSSDIQCRTCKILSHLRHSKQKIDNAEQETAQICG